MAARSSEGSSLNRWERELREVQITEASKKVAAIDVRLERVEAILAEISAELMQIDELVKALVAEVRAGNHKATE